MTLLQLLTKASHGYPDRNLAAYFDAESGRPKPGSGDTLAEFIVKELADTFDPDAADEEQIRQALWALRRAQWDLHDTIRALERRSPTVPSSGRCL
jgi:hypothetical protein